MKQTLTATLIAALASPALAGGPVVLEEAEVVAERPSSNIFIPLLAVVAVGLLLANDDEEEPPPP